MSIAMSPEVVYMVALGSYGVISTVAIISLSIYTYRMRRQCHCRAKSQSDISEDMRRLHRTSELNAYETDSPPKLHRTLSVPISPMKSRRILSEYDSVNCVSIPHKSTGDYNEKLAAEPKISSEPEVHHYEEVDNSKKTRPRAYETIISQVVSSLSEIYNEKPSESEIYLKFMEQLMTAIETKDKSLHESLRQRYSNHYRHHYEEINEMKERHDAKELILGAEDDGYATYMPPGRDKGNASNTLLGSSDHLKYFKESKSTLPRSEKDAPYLQAKQFVPTSDCPEELKKLCRQEDFCGRRRHRTLPSESQLEEACADYQLSLPSCSTISSGEYFLKDEQLNRDAFARRAQKVEKALNKPPVPPKNKSRSYSTSEDEPFL